MNVPQLDSLVARWRASEETRHGLISRLKLKGRQSVDENDLAQEFYRVWLELPEEEPMRRLMQHPLLTKDDQQRVEGYLEEQKQEQAKYGFALTAGTLLFHSLLLSKLPKMQRIFNNRSRHIYVNRAVKVVSCYCTFLCWMLVLNNHYEKTIPQGVAALGIFKQYRIPYGDFDV